MNTPTVFISYSHDDKKHEEWVLKLASDLRSHGVNAILDQWDLRLGSDLRLFMENGLSSSNLVLCICSEEYVKKVNAGKGGAGYEGMIMTQSLLSNANSEFVISIVRNNSSSQKVPIAFGSKLYIDFSDDAQYVAKYSELLERIYGEDSKKKPPLGENPFSKKAANYITIKTDIEKSLYRNPQMEGIASFNFQNNSGRFTIGSGDYEFVTKWSKCGNTTIYAYNDDVKLIGYCPGQTSLPEKQEFSKFDFTSRVREISIGEIVIFMNHKGKFAAVLVKDISIVPSKKAYLLSFQYRIYP